MLIWRPAVAGRICLSARGDNAFHLIVAKCDATIHVRFVPFQQILGIRFFDGEPDQAVEMMLRNGGFLIAPSGTCFSRLRRDVDYRNAVTRSDIAIPDSGAMVLCSRVLRGRKIRRISGLKYLQALSARLFSDKRKTLWILPNERALKKLTEWLRSNQILASEENFYVAPIYGLTVEDRPLLEKIEQNKPEQIVVAIGSGPQEKLGYFLREHLSAARPVSVPPIHCIGAALGFLTGEQVKIPDWADRFYLGWLLRLLSRPRIFIPRLARALELPYLIARYGSELPPMRGK
jgi:N-acetylglucosaminyldiphosphoundecaprenol N-acetyl-beta-D-mannosaminyltransferase